MLKHLPTVAGVLLGLLFVAAGGTYLLGLAPAPPEAPADSPLAQFMAAFVPTGYLVFVKICEVVGGVLVAIPRTRNAGLLVLGPVIVNILAFHVFITAGEGLWEPLLLVIVALAAYLLWAERQSFARLLIRTS